jgi:nucleoside-diphosphate-sugar epimerase
MTENSPIGPPSKKGEVRKQLNEMIMNEVQKGSLTALIARSADFYGPDTNNSIIGEMVVKNLMKNKKAQAFGDINKIHTYTYTPDAGKATALLGNTADAFSQVWHVPTTKERLTNQQWINLIAEEMDLQVKIQAVPNWMIHMLGIFIPMMREFPEMVYQNEMDYIFDSSKFEKRFGLTATTPRDGVKEMINYFKRLNTGR